MWTPEVEEALYTKQYWNILIEAQTAISFMNEAHESYSPYVGIFDYPSPPSENWPNCLLFDQITTLCPHSLPCPSPDLHGVLQW